MSNRYLDKYLLVGHIIMIIINAYLLNEIGYLSPLTLLGLPAATTKTNANVTHFCDATGAVDTPKITSP